MSTATIRAAIAAQGAVAIAAAAVIGLRGNGDTEVSSPSSTSSASKTKEAITPRKALHAADGIVQRCRDLGFVCTAGASGSAPDCRIMDLHRIATRDKSPSFDFALVSRDFTRKAKALSGESTATIAFHDRAAYGENGYCVLSGSVRELRPEDHQAERQASWKGQWSYFHSGPHNPEVAMWRFQPQRLEVIAHKEGVSRSWAPVALRRGGEGEAPWELLPAPAEVERAIARAREDVRATV